MPTAIDDTWVPLAVFAQPHGVSGRIKLKSLTDEPEGFGAYPVLTDAHGNAFKLTLTGHAQGMAIVAVEGVTRREQAELLRGRKIGAPRAALPKLRDPNRFYIHDLVGLQAETADGKAFGTVTQVMNFGAGDILEIARIGGQIELFSFTHVTFPTVDLARKRLVIDPPEVIRSDA